MTLVAPPSVVVVDVALRAVLKKDAPGAREAVKVKISRVGEAILMVGLRMPDPVL